MRKLAVLLALLVLCCNRRPDGPQFDERAFITAMILNTVGNADVAALAARRGQSPETRELAAMVHRVASEMRDDLTRIAQRRNVPVPNGREERKVALKENLEILQGQSFDQAYALAMVQELNAMLPRLDGASASSDAELRQVARKYRRSVEELQRAANRLLNHVGGSPWAAVSR